jgi:hypothetical protein
MPPALDHSMNAAWQSQQSNILTGMLQLFTGQSDEHNTGSSDGHRSSWPIISISHRTCWQHPLDSPMHYTADCSMNVDLTRTWPLASPSHSLAQGHLGLLFFKPIPRCGLTSSFLSCRLLAKSTWASCSSTPRHLPHREPHLQSIPRQGTPTIGHEWPLIPRPSLLGSLLLAYY